MTVIIGTSCRATFAASLSSVGTYFTAIHLTKNLQAVVRKLNEGIQPLADRVMTVVLQLIQAAGKTSTVLEDAFLVVGSLASGTYML
jgi:hypothetical protein